MKAIFWGGLWCGVLDITAAFVTSGVRGVSPARVLRFVASGLLGPSARQGGVPTAALGLLLHFFIAFTAAAVYYAASRVLPVLLRHAAVCGVAYGVVVYLVMYMVVRPLAGIPFGHPPAWSTIIAVLTHMLCVGLPIGLAVRRYSV
jgi:hypothetical protein